MPTALPENIHASADRLTSQCLRARSIHRADWVSFAHRSRLALDKQDDGVLRWSPPRRYLRRVQSASKLTIRSSWLNAPLRRRRVRSPLAIRRTRPRVPVAQPVPDRLNTARLRPPDSLRRKLRRG